MDKMNLVSVLTSTVPESLLSIVIGFLIIGKRNLLTNILKLIATVILFSMTSFLVRYFIPNELLSVLLQVTLDSAILFYIYKVQIKEAIASCLFFTLVLLTAELILLAPLMSCFNMTKEMLYATDMSRFLYGLIDRGFQVFTIISLWNAKVVFIDMKKYSSMSKITTFMLLLIYAFELIFVFTYVKRLDIMSASDHILHILGCLLAATINVTIFIWISKNTSTVREVKEKTNVINTRLQVLSNMLKGE